MTGTIEIDRYILETLMRDLVGHDRRPAAYLIFLAIIGAGEGAPVAASYQQLADQTGLSKRTVQHAVGHLARRGLLGVERRGPTEPALFRPLAPWRR